MTGLLTDEHRARWSGRTRTYTAPEPFGAAAGRYFGLAIGDDNPLYSDPEYARAHGLAGVTAPLTLICETNQYANLPSTPDGVRRAHLGHRDPGHPTGARRQLLHFHRRIRPEDVITATWEIADVTEKTTRSRPGDARSSPPVPPTPTRTAKLLAENEETMIFVRWGADGMSARGRQDAIPPLERPSRSPTWSPTPGPRGTGTGCTTTRSSSRPRSCPRAGRRRPGVRRAAGRADAGLARPALLRAQAGLHLQGPGLRRGDRPLRGHGHRGRRRPAGRSSSGSSWSGRTTTVAPRVAPSHAEAGRDRCCSASRTVRGCGRRGRMSRASPSSVPPSATSGSPTARSWGCRPRRSTRALADAGLTLRDVDGIATTGVSRFSATQLADYFGIQPRWTDSTFAGGSAFEMFVARAAQAIEAGQAETVVISFASNQRSARSRSLGGVVEDAHPGGAVRDAVRARCTRSPTTPWPRSATCTTTAARGSSWPRSPSRRGSGRCSTRRRSATARAR